MGRKLRPRYAIATFDSGAGVAMAVLLLTGIGVDANTLELMARSAAFEQAASMLAGQLACHPRRIAFSEHQEEIACTPGAIAGLLVLRAGQGGVTLVDALDIFGFRHLAESLARSIDEHRLLLWIPIRSGDAERMIGQALLARGQLMAYEVHDLPRVESPGALLN